MTQCSSSLLHIAFYAGNINIIRALLAKGLQLTQVTQDGLLPIYHVFQRESSPLSAPDIELLRLYFSYSSDEVDLLEQETPVGWTLLHRCAAYGTEDALQYLLDLGASTTVQSKERKWTPIFAAVAHNPSVRVLEILLKHSSPEAHLHTDVRGWTLLHIAAATGKSNFVELLLKHGSDENALSLACDSVYVPENMRNRRLTPVEVARYSDPPALESYTIGLDRFKRSVSIHRHDCVA